jgi:hypothetical protein
MAGPKAGQGKQEGRRVITLGKKPDWLCTGSFS